MGGKLPALRRGEVEALCRDFSQSYGRNGDKVTGTNREGAPYSIHLLHGGGLRPDQLSRTLGYLGVSRAEFWEWRRQR